MKYVFFYDETEHSRKINYQTVTADNYCDRWRNKEGSIGFWLVCVESKAT